jgi:hypothetical protein
MAFTTYVFSLSGAEDRDVDQAAVCGVLPSPEGGINVLTGARWPVSLSILAPPEGWRPPEPLVVEAMSFVDEYVYRIRVYVR